MSLVSVIMPTYNAEKWVAATIDSISAQTYPGLELIVVDDGSSDDTVSVVRKKLQKDFKSGWQIFELGANRGPSAARNVGLRAASGSWVQFIDSDDFLAPTKFARQMAVCAKVPAHVSAVYSPWRRCYVDSGRMTWEGRTVDPDMRGKPPIMCLVAACRPLHSAGLARRATLDRIGGFDESLRFWECEEINVRLAQAGALEPAKADEPLYVWRLHREKIYIGGDEARYRSTHVAMTWISQLLKAAENKSLDQLNLCRKDRDSLLNDCTLWARLLYSHDRSAFTDFLVMARKLDPNIAPSNPKYVSRLSRHIGYERAEAIAKVSRTPKTFARKALQRLKLRPSNSLFDWN